MQANYPGDATIPARTVTYQYDVTVNLKQTTDSAGPVDLYTYDKQGKELSHTQQKSDGTQNTEIITTSIRYDKAGNKRFVVDGNNVTTENIYNDVNKLTSSKITVTNVNDVSALQTTNYGYDADGNQTTKTDWLGNTYTNVYDPLDRLIQKVDPNHYSVQIDPLTKSIEKLGYNHNSVQIKSTDALNKITQFTYDKNNRLLSTIDPLNHSKSQTYDNVGNIQTTTDGRGKVTTNNYDALNRLTSVVNAKNETTSYTYDLNNNMLTQSNGAGHVTIYEYNVANKLTKKIDHGGRIYETKYIDIPQYGSQSYTFSANSSGLMTFKTGYWQTSSDTYLYLYNSNNNLLASNDDSNGTWYSTINYKVTAGLTYTVVVRGWNNTAVKCTLTGVPSSNYTDTPSKTESYTYKANGTLDSKLDRNGNTTTYTYDVHGRMLSQAVGTLSISYTYDDNGNQLEMIDSTGTTTRAYDQLNRTKSKTVPGGSEMTFLYDVRTGLPAGQVAETDTDPKGNVTTKVFDKAGRMISVTASGQTTTYTYYDNGSKHKVLYPDGSREDYDYYDDGTLALLENNSSNYYDLYFYTYDAAHNQTSKDDAKGTTTYTYDNLNRLATVTEPGGKVTAYTFDGAGNRAMQTETTGTTNIVTTYSYNEQNRLTNTITQQNTVTTQTVAYTYDNNGNQLLATKVPYVNGTPQTAQLTSNTYDKLNQLSTTNMPDATVITYTYNGEGYRVTKQVNSQITKYVYVGDKVVLELDGSNNQTARNVQGTSLIARTVGGTTLTICTMDTLM